MFSLVFAPPSAPAKHWREGFGNPELALFTENVCISITFSLWS